MPARKPKKKASGKTDPCWKGYKAVGMKNKKGRKVPNCVPSKSKGMSRGR